MEYELSHWIDKYLPDFIEQKVSSMGGEVQEGFVNMQWDYEKKKVVIDFRPTPEFIAFMEKTKHKKYEV